MANPEKKTKATAKENVKEEKKPVEDVKSLSKDDLQEVTGGVNPFAKIPRVDDQPIDEDLRKNG